MVMRRFLSTSFIATAVSGLIIGIVFVFFAVGLATRSHPKPYSVLHTNVNDTVEVYRNSFGIPHLIAESSSDLFFSIGYVHAEDRMWQMDMFRRTAQGRLAEVQGITFVSTDVFMRMVGLPDIADRLWDSVSSTTKGILEAYSKGVNSYLQNHRKSLSFEFDALDYSPEPWHPKDCLLLMRLMAFEASHSFIADVVLSSIARQRGVSIAREYLPRDSSSYPALFDTTLMRIDPLKRKSESDVGSKPSGERLDSAHSESAQKIELQTSFPCDSRLHLPRISLGCNSWVVSHGSNQGALVANDHHGNLSLPSQWYQLHITASQINCIGMSIPGIPLIISGRNDSIAWAISNSMIDDADFYRFEVDHSNINYYFDAKGKRSRFRFVRDTIRIKGQADTLIDIRATEYGTVISDGHMLGSDPSSLFGVSRVPSTSLLSDCISFNWTGRYDGDEILALFRLNTARSVDELTMSFVTWTSPLLSVVAGDVTGRILIYNAGKPPIRNTTNAYFVNEASDTNSKWQGLYPASSLGVLKRNNGYLVSANNAITRQPAPYPKHLHESGSRSERIIDLLSRYENYTARDAQVTQTDGMSPYSVQSIKLLLPYLQRGAVHYRPVDSQALSILSNWNGIYNENEPGGAVFSLFYHFLVLNTFGDELGYQLYHDYLLLGSVVTRRMAELLHEPSHFLFDDIRTDSKEDLQWIAIRSFIEGNQLLAQLTGRTEAEGWKYGDLNKVTIRHPLASRQLFATSLTYGPFETGGHHTAINATSWSAWNPGHVTKGSTMRVVSDLRDTIQYVVLPGGSSGQPLSPNFSDQLQLWLKGGYVRLTTFREPGVGFTRYLQILPA